jgi:hypothetical protein
VLSVFNLENESSVQRKRKLSAFKRTSWSSHT